MSSGHRALVTGASRGIGRGVAVALAGAGHSVAATARSADQLEETVARARAAGAPTAAALPFDAANPPAAVELADRATEALDGFPDIFVHCAGIARNGPMGSLSLAEWEESVAVNVTSAFVLASSLGPKMAQAGWGRIVTIGSLYSLFAVARTAAYSSTKHALLGLTRVMSAEWVKHGVTANLIAPGFVDTEMVASEAAAAAEARGTSADEIIKKFLRIQPLGRMVTTDEVGALVAFLCSDAAAPITGQSINIDGGAYQN
jgi:NAD(P)-dependent dehydrogenase (short-subunit alcohol dehydrogenase family)